MPAYLDYNATAPIRPEAIAAITAAMALPLNASSSHRQGREAKRLLEQVRRTLAEKISCFPDEIVFTGSATEANNMALKAFAGGGIVTSAIEHPSVMNAAAAVRAPVDRHGVIDPAALDALLSQHRPALVSLMLANNETGVIQPVAELREIVHRHGARLHCDAVQALGKIPIDLGLLGCDLMTLAAHKMGGPPGVGALVVRQGLDQPPLLLGGGQEKRRRAGTEAIAALLGWQAALAAPDDWTGRNAAGHHALEARLKHAVPEMQILGASAPRLPNCSSLLMPGVSAETQLMHFDLAGFSLSAGSACSSGRIEASHVTRAMGIDEQAGGVIRVSSGWATRPQELETFAEQWLELYKRLVK